MEYLTKKQMDNLDIESLPEARRGNILNIKKELTMTDASIMDFGLTATENLNKFSTTTLQKIKRKDFPEINAIISDLMVELQKVDSNTLLTYSPPWYKRILGSNRAIEKFVEDFTSEFDTVADIIEKIKKKMQGAKFELKKDMIMCDQFMEEYGSAINDLDDCIFAERMKLDEVQNEISYEMESLDKEDMLAVHMMNMKQNALNRLEMNVQDNLLIRENAVQSLRQLSLIKEGDAVLIDKIQKAINLAIPTWEAQMVVAFIVARQQNCVDLEKAICDTLNNMITMNSELVKSGAIKVAQELQRGIIDIEVLKKSSQTLRETFDEVKKINIDGKQTRVKAIEELGKISIGLNEAMLIEEKDL
ncbi:toxic anion resistance protein [Hungatella hathewayi]|uniref:toxic anion resistance protein n=1 Tax=Hungatella hathewayi TaxID=154046 RepID=UPI00356164CE